MPNKNALSPVVDDYITDEGEILDREAGEKYLAYFEQQISLSFISIALALKNIRDQKLYIFRGCTSMQEYAEQYLPMSDRYARYYLQVADSFSEHALKKFDGANLKLLVEISKNEDLLEEANSDDPDVDELIRQAREREKKKHTKKIEEMQTIMDGKDAIMENLRGKLQEKDEDIDRLKDTVQEMAASKGVDAAAFTFVTQKKEAVSLIEETFQTAAKNLSAIQNIPSDLMDAELTAHLTFALSAVRASTRRVEDTFFMQLTAAKDDIGIIPE